MTHPLINKAKLKPSTSFIIPPMSECMTLGGASLVDLLAGSGLFPERVRNLAQSVAHTHEGA